MLSTLVDALDVPEGASDGLKLMMKEPILPSSGLDGVPRAGVFQPKVKARVRKGGGRGDAGASVAVKAPPAAPAAEKPVSALPVASDTEPLDGNQNNAEENEISQPDFKVPDAPLSIEENCVPEPLLPITSSTTTLEETVGVIDSVSTEVTKVTSPSRTSSIEPAIHSSPAAEDGSLLLQAEDDVIAAINAPEVSPPVAVRSNFPLPSFTTATEENEDTQGDALPRSGEPSSKGIVQPTNDEEGGPNGVIERARENKFKKSARKVRKTEVATPTTSSKEAEVVDDDLEETLVTLDDELMAELGLQEEDPPLDPAVQRRKRKRAFPHASSRPRRVQEGADSVKITRAYLAKELKIKAKDELAKKSLLDISKPREREVVREAEPQRDVLSLAPQVQVINGRIVVNEQSLTVGAYATSAQDTDKYTRVEENASRLNYHTYSNRTVTERWKAEETDIFYRAIRQFGTDFDLIKNLFPNRTRRQIKAKYKKEENSNPRRVSDALTYRPKDQSHYEDLLVRMKCDDLIQDNSDPFASILAYTADKVEKTDVTDKVEVEETQTEEEIPASIVE
ncbi:hypothetical protein AXG93_872s1160 [Marchantia polymorpha subsp. ruderalis]|uniref:SANT domain-containing protein n=1 Tax=Marchantia polymorpha subsp. ruderalis TaxID=1480154 RepID=A0A176VKR3_MARPO|nr:hypothetical protein AXG93_872s1160 [Marchantia polymorpha subsp. ruderalis]